MTMKLCRILTVSSLALGILAMAGKSLAAAPVNTLYLDLNDGRAVDEQRHDLPLGHSPRHQEPVTEGFYATD